MSTKSNENSRRMYSWWWDSHISPKNSKWLQENLTDMDSKVKQMIKLIEEDADSFARRAEMYYKKRPELMKLVEELYRAYRALAERYDNATGVIRHAHRTMSEAFPNQLPMLFGDESSAGASSYEGDPRTPEMSPLVRNGAFTEESDSVSNRQGLKQLNDLAAPGSSRARRGLNFQDGDENEQNSQSNGNHNLNARFLSESEQVCKAEAEIMALKNALAKLEAEKEASVLQCQQSMEKLSNLESEVYLAQEDSRGLNERSRKAEAEVQLLKESIVKLESEKEFSLLQYKKCLQKISDLEAGISHAQKDIKEVNVRASETEAETQALKKDLASVEIEKDTALVQYRQCLEKISYLEDRLQSAEEEVSKIKTRAEKAEVEVENLKQIISTLSKEKEASALQYQHCVDTIADLKLKLFQAQEEAQRLSRDIEDGTAKLRIAEEKCGLLENSNQTLHSELDILLQKLGNQSQELTEKQKELGRLWTSIQEEHLRFLEAETAFQTLQQLHSQSEEELRLLTAERQTRAQILKDVETRNDALQEAVQKFKEENKGLNDVNLSSAASIKSLQEEISSLRGTIEKLEAEVELRVDQRNALQQEIYCLKEELNEISQKHQAIKDQVEVVGLDPESLGSSVKELQDENSNLKVSLEKERSESTSLLEKLAVMEKLVEKNVVLGRSISDLNAEIEQIRGKVKTLEGSCESLLKEKSVLVNEKETLSSQLQISTETMGKLSKTNILLENSLLDATAELEGLRIQLRRLEDSCLQLDDEKSGLITEKENLASQLGITRSSLEDLGKQHAELTMKVLAIEKEREGSVHKIEELKAVVDVKNEEFASLVQSSQDRMGVMELQIHQLEEENRCREKEYQEELGRGICSQIEQFVLQKCLEDLFEKNVSLKVDYDGIREAYSLSERLISDKEHENREQQMQIESLADGVRILRLGLQQILERLGIEPSLGFVDEREQDLKVMGDVVSRVDEMQNILSVVQDENQHSAIQNVVLVALLRQLKSEAADIAREKRTLDREFKIQCLQLFSLQSEIQKLVKMSGKLTSEVKERGLREEALKTEVDRLNKQLLCLQDAYKELQEENIKILDEKRFLSKMVVCLEEEKNNLEDEICLTLSEALYQGSLSLILKVSILDKLSDVKNLSGDLGRLHCIKDKLEEKVHDREGKLKDAQSEYTQLCESLNKYETELSSLRYINDQFSHEITTCKDLLCQKEQELLEVAQMLSLVQNEKTVLVKEMNDLTSKHHEVSAQQKNQEKHILKLCRDFDDQVSETRRVSEAKQTLESELQKLHQELEETRQEKERLSDKVVKERIDASHWESQAAGYYENLQMSTVYEILLKGKVHELAKDLEINSASKDVEFNQLKERLSCLEDENKELKAHAAKHIQAVGLLNDSILSLENCVHSDAKSYDDVTKSSDYVTTVHAGGHAQAGEDEPLGLQSLHVRVKIIEEALREKERVLIIENSSANSKLETAMKQIEYLKSGSRRSKKKQDDDSRRQKHDRRISREEIEVVTKDIMLDQISDCSSYGTSKRATVEADDQKILETAEQTSGSDKKLEKLHKVDNGQTVDVSRRGKGKTFSEDSIIDKLEISDRFGDPNPQTNQRKVLERLDSDLQKLSNLQITVQDLKGRVEVNDNGKNKKGVEQETVKGQLEEAEEAITKLFDVNRKLTTRVEKGFSPSDGKSGDVEDNGSGRRVRISEMARRASEKIGRLQLEVQRIQFLLLKLDGEREKSKVSEKDKRVLLKDYIYSGTRSGGMKKKKASRFCACVQPRSP